MHISLNLLIKLLCKQQKAFNDEDSESLSIRVAPYHDVQNVLIIETSRTRIRFNTDDNEVVTGISIVRQLIEEEVDYANQCGV